MDKKQLVELLKQNGVKVVGNYVHKDDLRKLIAAEKKQAEVAVLALKLDGHGRNFSKQEIKEMREELTELGAYNNAEVDDMDDEDVLGYWQSETGYVESDDAG
jgi:Holliday junction resolvase